MRLLVVEDEPNLNELIVKKLRLDNYTVDACMNGQDALDFYAMADYDAIILDVMLPGISGLDFLKNIRNRNSKIPVLLLTARDSIEDRVAGLDTGADDYLVKPFAFDELLARIRVMLRRSSGNISNIFTLADLKLDCDTWSVTRNNIHIALSSKEFSILEYLIRNAGIVLSREKIS